METDHDLTIAFLTIIAFYFFSVLKTMKVLVFPAHPEVALGYCDVHCAAEKGKEGSCDDGAKTNLNQISLSYISMPSEKQVNEDKIKQLMEKQA